MLPKLNASFQANQNKKWRDQCVTIWKQQIKKKEGDCNLIVKSPQKFNPLAAIPIFYIVQALYSQSG